MTTVEDLTPVRFSHDADCPCTKCQGFKAKNTHSLKYGAHSERQIRPVARNHRRRLMRQFGLRSGDLDPIGRAYLELLSKATAKVALIDEWLDEHGLLREDGTPQPCTSLYVSLLREASRSLARLEQHLRLESADPEQRLREFLASGGR